MRLFRRALVTGASRGIGKAIALELAQHCDAMILVGRNPSALLPLTDELGVRGVEVEVVEQDLQNPASVLGFSQELAQRDVDLFVNNAGMGFFKAIEESGVDESFALLNTNLVAPFLIMHALIPGMKERARGHIVSINSVAALKAFRNCTVYGASKMGLLGLTRSLREEVREHGIVVIDVFPGATSTEIWPDDALKTFGHRMMNPQALATVITATLVSSTTGGVVPEELVLRPQLGDL